MSQESAVAKARILRGYLLATGIKTVSIELLEGRGGSGWDRPTHVATLGHHTVSKRTQGDTPCLKLVKVGRTGIPGPLCNGYGGFDEIARIICMAWANHPGEGGPVTVEAGVIPENNGRPYLFGWEFEGGIDIADFTSGYRLFMARCHLGTLNYLQRSLASHHEHKTWAPTRKVDRLGYSLAQARSEIRNAVTAKEDTMILRSPANGNHIKVWQTAINEAIKRNGLPLTPVTVDGIYGAKTVEAVTAYQFSAGIAGLVPEQGALDDYTRDLLVEYTRADA